LPIFTTCALIVYLLDSISIYIVITSAWNVKDYSCSFFNFSDQRKAQPRAKRAGWSDGLGFD
jgi:hypothetical protein